MVEMLIWTLYILVLGWFAFFSVVFIGIIYEYAQKRRFYATVRETVKINPFVLDRCTKSIKNSYDVYRRHRFITISEPIIDICQELAMNMRNGKYLNSYQLKNKDELANRVDSVIEQIRKEQQFDDEKAYEIITELSGKIPNETLEKIKRNLTFLEAYHKGIISVKNAEIKDVKNKMRTKKWIAWITGTLGVIGSIASIVALFLTK